MKIADAIRTGEAIPIPLSGLLLAATPLTRIGMFLRSLKPVTRVDAHVISIGNLTAGGTGKTPAVIRYAREHIAAGKKVGILTRGYGTASTEKLVVSADIEPAEHCAKLGDEPAVILRHCPEAIIFKSKNRVHAAQIAVDEYQCDVLILDDGYQYLPLHRDENILLIDACNPFGNGHLLPRGFLREPVAAMTRATRILVTRCDQSDQLDLIRGAIRKIHPDCPVEWTQHAPTALVNLATGEKLPLDHFEGQDVVAACAIGNPEAFHQTLSNLGMNVTELITAPDHAPLPESALTHDPTIITEKDAVRLTVPTPNLYSLTIELHDH
ncbi:MAG: tetraacyldisaccharide 4'-kinase [Candidatus Hydrogenedentota bacterium]